MIINCLNCGKSVSVNLNNCPYCKWEMTEILIKENAPHAHNYKETLNKVKGTILDAVLRYAQSKY